MNLSRVFKSLLAVGALTFAVGDGYETIGYGNVGYPGTVGYADAPQVAAPADSTAAPDGAENGQKADDNNHGKSTNFILDFDLTSVSFSDMREGYSADIGGFGLKFGLQKRIAKISSNFDVVGEGLLGFALDYGDVMNDYYGELYDPVYLYDTGLRLAALGRFNFSIFFVDAGYQTGYDFAGFISGGARHLSYNCDYDGCSEQTSGLVMSIPVDFGVKLGSKVLGARFAYDVIHPFSEYDASAYAFSFYVGL